MDSILKILKEIQKFNTEKKPEDRLVSGLAAVEIDDNNFNSAIKYIIENRLTNKCFDLEFDSYGNYLGSKWNGEDIKLTNDGERYIKDRM